MKAAVVVTTLVLIVVAAVAFGAWQQSWHAGLFMFCALAVLAHV